MKRAHALIALSISSLWGTTATASQTAPALQTTEVSVAASATAVSHDGVVEAIRQTIIAAQVPGAVVALDVKAGDKVKAGQVLLRIDARAADHLAAAGAAQVLSAQAARDAATRELERQKQLFEKQYISQAALDRAEMQFKAARAQADAQFASARAAQTESVLHVVKAPYGGVVADVTVVLGDMAMPGRPLLTVYDPAALRVRVAVPQSHSSLLAAGAIPQVEFPGIATRKITPIRAQLLPSVDPATHTQELRLDLPAGIAGLQPGLFARAWLPGAAADNRLQVPSRTVVRRAELAGVYVVSTEGKPMLRQVRLGLQRGDQVEVLSGLAPGERVALDPQAAARVR